MRRRAWPQLFAALLSATAPALAQPDPAVIDLDEEAGDDDEDGKDDGDGKDDDDTANPGDESRAARSRAPAPKPKQSNDPKQPGDEASRFEPVGPVLGGYVQPAFGITFRPDALPRDRVDYGARESRAGLLIKGERFQHWKYVIHIVVDPDAVGVVSDAELVDRDGNGTSERLNTSKRTITGVRIEQVTIDYNPFDELSIKAGQMRLPFTVGHRSANTALMFPTRGGVNRVFLSGSDRGVLVSTRLLDGKTRASVGAFDGSSLGLGSSSENARGLVYSLRTDVEPFGELPGKETDFERGPFRAGVGFGLLYRDVEVFDATGYEGTSASEVRLSASLRLMIAGASLQAELLRWQRSDNLSDRPQQATGAYGQSGYFFPVSRDVALAPLARVGFTSEDETTRPREVLFIEAGLALFPAAGGDDPSVLRVLLEYNGERRLTEQENADGATLQLSYKF